MCFKEWRVGSCKQRVSQLSSITFYRCWANLATQFVSWMSNTRFHLSRIADLLTLAIHKRQTRHSRTHIAIIRLWSAHSRTSRTSFADFGSSSGLTTSCGHDCVRNNKRWYFLSRSCPCRTIIHPIFVLPSSIVIVRITTATAYNAFALAARRQRPAFIGSVVRTASICVC